MNRNGFLEEAEFNSYFDSDIQMIHPFLYSEMMGAYPDTASYELFTRIDYNMDGKVDKIELKDFLTVLSSYGNRQQYLHIFDH